MPFIFQLLYQLKISQMIFVNVIVPRMYLLKSHFSISVAVNYFIKNGTEDVLLCGNSTDAG